MTINKLDISALDNINEYIRETTVELEYFVVSFGTLVFRIVRKNENFSFLCFSEVSFINCPNKMSNVKFNIHNEDTKESVKKYMPGGDLKLSSELLFDIESREGNFTILATVLWLGNEEDNEKVRATIENAVSLPIWKGGITFANIATI